METVRFGIIGVGNIAPHHAEAIRNTPGAELVAVATRNPERGQAFAAEQGARWFGDYREMLALPGLDVVTICTPHDLHVGMTEEAAAHGKHVLCEKPMARTVAECDRMIAACEAAGVMLGVVFQARFNPLARKLKEGIVAGRLGRLFSLGSHTIWFRSAEYYRSAAWRGTWAHEGGGVLINQAAHDLDLLLWLGGSMPERVTAQMRTLNHDIEVEDLALAILEYAGGALGLVQATTDAYPGLPERLEFYGSNGSASFHKGQGRLEWHLMEPRQDWVDETAAKGGQAQPMSISAVDHASLFRDYVAALREGRPPLVDGYEGRHSVELIEAIYRSSQSGQAVLLGDAQRG